MSESEKAIIAINGAARAKGLSYGQFVSRATAEELEAIVFRFRASEQKKKKK